MKSLPILSLALLLLSLEGFAVAKDLPDPPPDFLELEVDVIGGSEFPEQSLQGQKASKQTRHLVLHRYTIRSKDFRIRRWDGSKLVDEATIPSVRTYRGTTKENPNEIVVAVLYPDGHMDATGSIGMKQSFTLPQSTSPEWLDVSSRIDGPAGTDDGRSRWPGSVMKRDASNGLLQEFPPNRPLKRGQLLFDITKDCLQAKQFGGDWEASLAFAEYNANLADFVYTRDIAVSFELTDVVIRDVEIYPDLGADDLQKMTEFRAQMAEIYKEEYPTAKWDYAHALLAPGHGGVSNLGGPYSLGPAVHEIGHSLSMEHEVYGIDLQNPWNNNRTLADLADRKLIDRFDDASESDPTKRDPLLPTPNPDVAVTAPNTRVIIPALGNDWDSNGEPIHIGFFNEKTERGGFVRKISIKEKSGASLDALEYAPPRDFVGKDAIIYEVKNQSGLGAYDVVHIHVVDEKAPVAAQWLFDALVNRKSPDGTPAARHATVSGNAKLIDGAVGKALEIQGGAEIVLGDCAILPERPKEFLPGFKSRWGWYPLEEEIGNDFDPLNLDYSIAFWFHTSQIVSESAPTSLLDIFAPKASPGVILDKTNTTAMPDAAGFRIIASEKGFVLSLREFDGRAKYRQIIHRTHPEADTWYHIAVVIDRKRDAAKFYIDGKKASEDIPLTKGSYLFSGRSDLRLISPEGSTTAFDDMFLAYRAFSPNEISSLHARRKVTLLSTRTPSGRPPLATTPTTSTGINARYLRIEKASEDSYIGFAEVEVMSNGTNIAPKGTAKQSDLPQSPIPIGPEKAIDDDTNPDHDHGSWTRTKRGSDVWWEVDLRSMQPIESIRIWGYNWQGGYQVPSGNWRLTLMDEARKEVWTQEEPPGSGDKVSIEVKKAAD
ncbi:MAG: hypothetical protein QE273_09330 [Verrucomicrobiales bacterium]|nr:hypothetical protein [Verrucomicrobiales bacterium]